MLCGFSFVNSSNCIFLVKKGADTDLKLSMHTYVTPTSEETWVRSHLTTSLPVGVSG